MKYNLSKLNDPALAAQLESFLDHVIEKCGANLESVVLYGGVAKADYKTGKSNVNLLFVMDTIDLDVLDELSLLFQKATNDFKLAFFMLTSSEIAPSSDVFAVKLFDIKQHHILLHGTDLLQSIEFDKQHLKFIAAQELRNQLSRMKNFYVWNFNLPEQLLSKVQTGFTTLLINANTFLYLKKAVYFATRREIIEQLLLEPEMDETALRELLHIKEGTAELSPETIRQAYNQLMLQYKQLIKAFKQIQIHE
ncbi:MAG: hypothetical protein M3R17_07995 [Bacteroidota bacterium]|nr:hypothetical protein [Bacteroidota bacterium]